MGCDLKAEPFPGETWGRRRPPYKAHLPAGQEAEVEGERSGRTSTGRGAPSRRKARPRRAAAGGPPCRRADSLRPRKKRTGSPGKAQNDKEVWGLLQGGPKFIKNQVKEAGSFINYPPLWYHIDKKFVNTYPISSS